MLQSHTPPAIGVPACGVRRPLGLQGVGLPCLIDFLNEVHRFPCKTVWPDMQPLHHLRDLPCCGTVYVFFSISI